MITDDLRGHPKRSLSWPRTLDWGYNLNTFWGVAMSYRVYSSLPAVLVLSLSISVFAQGRPGGGGGGGTTGGGGGGGRPSGGAGNPTVPGNFPNPGLNIPRPTDIGPRPMYLSGKVVVEDGTPLTDPAMIQTICRGSVRNEGYTDSRGSFSIDLSSNAQRQVVGAADDSGSRPGGGYQVQGMQGGVPVRDMRECDIQAVLPGFRSQQVTLAGKLTDFGTADIGTVVLHRLGQVEGFTISATSALAPSKAKKLFDQGREQEQKQKWDAALEKFSKATEIYPKYAVAWFEMGRVQLEKKDFTSAKNSFHQAIAADRTYISPYEKLAQVAVNEQQWKDLAENTDELLRLNPVSFPVYWLYNSLANYYLKSFDKAEKSAQAGMNADAKHQVPKLEYMLGMVLIQKHDYPGALTHIRNYIRLVPDASDLSLAQKQVAELERLSASTAPGKP
jgi:tetratricopeptide (TPR) repeat protein